MDERDEIMPEGDEAEEAINESLPEAEQPEVEETAGEDATVANTETIQAVVRRGPLTDEEVLALQSENDMLRQANREMADQLRKGVGGAANMIINTRLKGQETKNIGLLFVTDNNSRVEAISQLQGLQVMMERGRMPSRQEQEVILGAVRRALD